MPFLHEHYAGAARHYTVGLGSGVHGLWFIAMGGFVPNDLQKGYRKHGKFIPIYHPKGRGTFRFWLSSAMRRNHRAFYAGAYGP